MRCKPLNRNKVSVERYVSQTPRAAIRLRQWRTVQQLTENWPGLYQINYGRVTRVHTCIPDTFPGKKGGPVSCYSAHHCSRWYLAEPQYFFSAFRVLPSPTRTVSLPLPRATSTTIRLRRGLWRFDCSMEATGHSRWPPRGWQRHALPVYVGTQENAARGNLLFWYTRADLPPALSLVHRDEGKAVRGDVSFYFALFYASPRKSRARRSATAVTFGPFCSFGMINSGRFQSLFFWEMSRYSNLPPRFQHFAFGTDMCFMWVCRYLWQMWRIWCVRAYCLRVRVYTWETGYLALMNIRGERFI